MKVIRNYNKNGQLVEEYCLIKVTVDGKRIHV